MLKIWKAQVYNRAEPGLHTCANVAKIRVVDFSVNEMVTMDKNGIYGRFQNFLFFNH